MTYHALRHAVQGAAVLSLVMLVTPSQAQEQPPPPTVRAVTSSLRVRTSYAAFLRSAPERRAGTDLAVIEAGTEVEVAGVVPDTSGTLGGYWYQVRTFPAQGEPLDGWMHSTIVYLAPEEIAALATPAPTFESGAEGSAEPPAPADATVVPPSSIPMLTPTTMEVPLALRICYDLHANATCDVDEGVGGITVYGADWRTGQVLLQATTDATGLARLPWTVPADVESSVTLTVPYFQTVRVVYASKPVVEPIVLTALAPIPAWLP